VLAEFRALTAARQEGIGKYEYTDSACAQKTHPNDTPHVYHLFGVLWKMRGFEKINWFHMLHCDQIVELMLALAKI